MNISKHDVLAIHKLVEFAKISDRANLSSASHSILRKLHAQLSDTDFTWVQQESAKVMAECKKVREAERHLHDMEAAQREWRDKHNGSRDPNIAISIKQAQDRLDALRAGLLKGE